MRRRRCRERSAAAKKKQQSDNGCSERSLSAQGEREGGKVHTYKRPTFTAYAPAHLASASFESEGPFHFPLLPNAGHYDMGHGEGGAF